MFKNKYIFIISLFLSVYIKSYATHIVGGEIYYDNLGGNNYKLNMKVYRDCINGDPPLDSPAFVTVFRADGSVYTTLNMILLSTTNVPPTNNSPCAPNTTNSACVQQGIYEAFINLPPLVGGYYIAYQRCCRNGTILNLINPGGVGTTYWEHIPGPELVAVNSSPRFNLLPPIYVCANIPIAFNHAATDPDGDSLVYNLCTPFNGLSGCCPIIGSGPAPIGPQCSSPPATCPGVNTPPPYSSVPFAAPYSASYPMASNPAININSSTGFLNGNPTILGQWVVGVCVSEYRNGVLIGTHHRDFQFNVISCPFIVNADIASQVTTNNGQGTGYCNGFTISYNNASSGNLINYFWDFGDPTTLADTSHAFNPTYTFPAVGDYTVTLIVNRDSLCTDTAYEVFHIHPLLAPDVIQPTAQCFNGNSFDFVGGGTFQGNGTFSWNFGANATPQTATTATINNVTYNAPGVYPLVFTVSENGCTASATETVTVHQNPIASIGNFSVTGCDPLTVNFPNQSTAGTNMSFVWNFSDGTSSTLQNPTHVFTPSGVYSVSLTVTTNQQCIDTSNVSAVNSITVNPTPSADFNIVSASGICLDNNSFNFNSLGTFLGAETLTWTFGANASPATASTKTVTNVVYNASGTYPVTLMVVENGCSDTVTKQIELYDNPVADFDSVNPGGCDPYIVNFNNQSTSASSLGYLWNFSDGTTSAEANPSHVFSPPGIYTYTLTVFTNDKCIDTSQLVSVHSITVSPSPIAAFTATPMVTTIFDPDINFFNLASADVVSWYYTFGDGASSNLSNPLHTYSNWGDYNVSQTVTNSYGCPHTARQLVKVLPEFRFWIPNSFTPGNHDGMNDVFKPVVIGVEDYEFTIYNRWGELIFRTTETDSGWNGTYKGKDSPLDVYVWKCTFKNIVTKQDEYHIGHVTLVR